MCVYLYKYIYIYIYVYVILCMRDQMPTKLNGQCKNIKKAAETLQTWKPLRQRSKNKNK